MPQLLNVLADVSESRWGWIEWLIWCRTSLHGARPADVIQAGRFDEVLAVAQAEASRRADTNW